MPYYNADVEVHIEQDWIDDHVSDTMLLSDAVTDRVNELVYKIKVLGLYPDLKAVDVLEEIRELIR